MTERYHIGQEWINKRSGREYFIVDFWKSDNLNLPSQQIEYCFRLMRDGKYSYVWESDLLKRFELKGVVNGSSVG